MNPEQNAIQDSRPTFPVNIDVSVAMRRVMDIMDNGVQQPVSEWKDMWVDWNMDTVLQ